MRGKTSCKISTVPQAAAGSFSHSGNPAMTAAQSHTEGSSLERGYIICCFLSNPNGMILLLLLIIREVKYPQKLRDGYLFTDNTFLCSPSGTWALR